MLSAQENFSNWAQQTVFMEITPFETNKKTHLENLKQFAGSGCGGCSMCSGDGDCCGPSVMNKMALTGCSGCCHCFDGTCDGTDGR